MPMMLINEDGSSSTYYIKKGDQLVYHLNAGGKEWEADFDLIVTINDEEYKKGIDFNYEMTNEKHTNGHLTISGNPKNESKKYLNFFDGGELNLTDACTLWITGANFSDLPEKKTTMQIDDEAPETFYVPEKNEVRPIIKIEEEDKTLDAFIINNAADGRGSRTIWINNISSNSLIIKMELGFKSALKEIR